LAAAVVGELLPPLLLSTPALVVQVRTEAVALAVLLLVPPLALVPLLLLPVLAAKAATVSSSLPLGRG
jgi:hypothetical protein